MYLGVIVFNKVSYGALESSKDDKYYQYVNELPSEDNQRGKYGWMSTEYKEKVIVVYGSRTSGIYEIDKVAESYWD